MNQQYPRRTRISANEMALDAFVSAGKSNSGNIIGVKNSNASKTPESDKSSIQKRGGGNLPLTTTVEIQLPSTLSNQLDGQYEKVENESLAQQNFEKCKAIDSSNSNLGKEVNAEDYLPPWRKKKKNPKIKWEHQISSRHRLKQRRDKSSSNGNPSSRPRTPGAIITFSDQIAKST